MYGSTTIVAQTDDACVAQINNFRHTQPVNVQENMMRTKTRIATIRKILANFCSAACCWGFNCRPAVREKELRLIAVPVKQIGAFPLRYNYTED